MNLFKNIIRVFSNENEQNQQETEHTIQHLQNEDKYIGQVINGQRHGKGTYIFANGDRYEGEWRDNMKHGIGKYYYKTGELFIGDWKENKREGYGKYFYQNGERYVGQWYGNCKQGQGSFYNKDGTYYKGEFVKNKRDGKGKYFTHNAVFDEVWEKGVKIDSVLVSKINEEEFEKIEEAEIQLENEQQINPNQDNNFMRQMSENCQASSNKVQDEKQFQEDKLALASQPIKTYNRNQRNKNDIIPDVIEPNASDETNSKNNIMTEVVEDDLDSRYKSDNMNLRIQTDNMDTVQEQDHNSYNSSNMINSIGGGGEHEFESGEEKKSLIGYDTIQMIEHIEKLANIKTGSDKQNDSTNSKTLNLMNKPLLKWDKDDIGQWLESINLSNFVEI